MKKTGLSLILKAASGGVSGAMVGIEYLSNFLIVAFVTVARHQIIATRACIHATRRCLIFLITWPKHLGASTKTATSRHSVALSRVDSVLKVIGLFLPSRIMKEDTGDAREVINKLVAESAPTWMIYTKLTSSVFWILLSAAREVLTVTKKKPS